MKLSVAARPVALVRTPLVTVILMLPLVAGYVVTAVTVLVVAVSSSVSVTFAVAFAARTIVPL